MKLLETIVTVRIITPINLGSPLNLTLNTPDWTNLVKRVFLALASGVFLHETFVAVVIFTLVAKSICLICFAFDAHLFL